MHRSQTHLNTLYDFITCFCKKKKKQKKPEQFHKNAFTYAAQYAWRQTNQKKKQKKIHSQSVHRKENSHYRMGNSEWIYYGTISTIFFSQTDWKVKLNCEVRRNLVIRQEKNGTSSHRYDHHHKMFRCVCIWNCRLLIWPERFELCLVKGNLCRWCDSKCAILFCALHFMVEFSYLIWKYFSNLSISYEPNNEQWTHTHTSNERTRHLVLWIRQKPYPRFLHARFIESVIYRAILQ